MYFCKTLQYIIKTFWNIKSLYVFAIEIKTKLPVKPLENLNWQTSLNLYEPIKSAGVHILVYPNSFGANATLNGNVLQLEIMSFLFGKRYSNQWRIFLD